MILRVKPKSVTVVRRSRPTPAIRGIGDWLYTPEPITDPKVQQVYDDFSAKSSQNIAEAEKRWNTLRPNKELADDFAKSLDLANKGVAIADSFINSFVFRKSMPAEKKDEIKQVQADLVESTSYWQKQGKTQPNGVSRPGTTQINQALAPYYWMDYAVKYNIVRDGSWSDTLSSVTNVPGDVLSWAGTQVNRGIKSGLGLDLPETLKPFLKYAPYVALGVGGLILYAVIKPYAQTVLPTPRTGR